MHFTKAEILFYRKRCFEGKLLLTSTLKELGSTVKYMQQDWCDLKLDNIWVMISSSFQILYFFFSFHSDSIHVLRAADLYFTQAVTDNKSDVLSEDRLLEIYSFLQNNLSSPQSQASLLYQNCICGIMGW